MTNKDRDRIRPSPIRIHDLAPRTADFRADALEGLRRPRKEISSKYLYDKRGSELFEQICTLPEYYPTRTEIGIMRTHGPEMARRLGPRCVVVEPGSGAGTKTRMLLDLLEDPAAYVPVEISREFLLRSVEQLAEVYPDLSMRPVCADFTTPFTLPPMQVSAERVAVFFPGSTIGNFEKQDSVDLLRNLSAHCGDSGAFLVGVDLKKDPAVLVAAYNDSRGVTARFNLNLLRRMNRELGADFRLDRFEHHPFWNEDCGCIEVHIRSLETQTVRIGGERISFASGETLRTEHCCKFSIAEFAALAGKAGLSVEQVWKDDASLFSVQLCRPRNA